MKPVRRECSCAVASFSLSIEIAPDFPFTAGGVSSIAENGRFHFSMEKDGGARNEIAFDMDSVVGQRAFPRMRIAAFRTLERGIEGDLFVRRHQLCLLC
jgi:hypothetical protein